MTDFSPIGYAGLLAAFRAQGYAAVDFAAVDPGARHLVLRHDIDVWPGYALPLAEAEAAAGMPAHYFVLVGSDLYNPAAQPHRSLLRRLIALGHRVGLHFDITVHGADADLDVAAASECRWLEDIAGAAVTMISFHRPAKEWLGNPRTLASRPHTYQPEYFRTIGYCSDSRGAWQSGHPLETEAVRRGRALQLLTHPVWWQGAGGVVASLDAYLARRCAEIDAVLAANVTVHQPGHLARILKERE